MKEKNINVYFEWLCSLVVCTQKMRCCSRLLTILHGTPFLYFIPNDDNRSYEGMNLREIFCSSHNNIFYNKNLGGECSMLELLISLAFRCEDLTDNKMCMADWFWVLICNCGLDRFDDVSYEHPCTVDGKPLWSYKEVDIILEKIINRTYKRNGQGGLFPMKRDRRDQRKVELWYQMCRYLVENYYAEDDVV